MTISSVWKTPSTTAPKYLIAGLHHHHEAGLIVAFAKAENFLQTDERQ